MDPVESSQSTPNKKGTKRRTARELETRIAEMMVARDAEQKKAMELHALMQELSRRTGELETQLSDQEEGLQKARKQAEDAATRVAALEKEAVTLREQLDLARIARSDAERVHDTESKKLKQQNESAQMEAVRLRAEAGALHAEAERLKKDLDQTREEAEQVGLQLDEAEAALETVKKDLERSRTEGLDSKESQAKVDAAESRSAELESLVAGLEEELEKAAEDVAKSESRSAALENEKAALGRTVAEMSAARDEARQRVMQFTEEHHELTQKQEEARSTLDAARAKNAELEAKSAALHSQLDAAETQAARSKRHVEELQHELTEAKAWEGRAKEAELATAQAKQNASERLADLVRFEKTRLEQERRVADLKAMVTELKEKLKEKGDVPAPAEEPEPIVMPEPEIQPEKSTYSALDDMFGPPASSPPPPPAAETLPASTDETTLRPQNLFGPLAADGRAAYILMELLAKDALGVLYRARERATDRQFGVRFLTGQAGESQTAAIEHTAEKLTALPHPNILHVQGAGVRKNRPYLAMDLVLTQTLGQLKIQEIPRIAAIVRDVAAAVHYAHEEGIFHGDLTPENILVTHENGQDHALVKDFGLAYLLETAPAAQATKDAASAIRNPAFLAPEQARVLKPALCAATDVYGLGVTLYAALSGKAPFEGKDSAQILKRVMIEEPAPLQRVKPGLPEPLAAIARRAMAKERGLRYATAQEMADALTKFLEGPAAAPSR